MATYARYGGIFNKRFTANLLENQPEKEFGKSVEIWQRCHHEYGVSCLWNTVYIPVKREQNRSRQQAACFSVSASILLAIQLAERLAHRIAALLTASLYTIIVLYGSPGHVWASYKLTSTNEDWRPSLVVILYTWAEG